MSQSRARVAIVMRTKDRPLLLRRALADVARQTFMDWHLVVVNDVGAREPVDALVAGLDADVAARVEVLHREASQGMESASNAGIAASNSEFCCIHDDDDTWDPRFLERTVAHLDAHPGEAAVVARAQVVNEEVRGEQVVETGREDFWPELVAISLSDLLRTNRFVPIQVLYRRSVHESVGMFREDLPVVGDWDFHLRLAQAFRIGLIDDVLAFWHHRRAHDAGALANSVLAEEHHQRADLLVRDEALKAHVAEHGMGDLLYLTRYLQGEFDHLHRRLNHLENRLDELEAVSREVGFTSTLRRKYHGLRSRARRG